MPDPEQAEAAEITAAKLWVKAEAQVVEAERTAAAAEEASRITAMELQCIKARLGDRTADRERVDAELKAALGASSDEAIKARMESARSDQAAANLQLQEIGDLGSVVAAAKVRVERLERSLRTHEEETKRLTVETRR